MFFYTIMKIFVSLLVHVNKSRNRSVSVSLSKLQQTPVRMHTECRHLYKTTLFLHQFLQQTPTPRRMHTECRHLHNNPFRTPRRMHIECRHPSTTIFLHQIS
jgi:hypothetical protein